jgi:hypothetical protein
VDVKGLLFLRNPGDKTDGAGLGWVLEPLHVLDKGREGNAVLPLRSFELVDFSARALLVARSSRSLIKVRTTKMLMDTARSLRRTDATMATPCSVKEGVGSFAQAHPGRGIGYHNL